MKKGSSVLMLIMLAAVICVSSTFAEDTQEVKIGVLAKRGNEKCLQQWNPTAEYLRENSERYQFRIVPLGFDEEFPAVQKEEVDFILTNPAVYVKLSVLYDVSRIATLKNLRTSGVQTVFGGVIFTRKDNDGIKNIRDIKGRSFMAVDETSFGGWNMAWREFKEQGVDPFKDFKQIKFGGTHDAVVYAVLNGEVEAGTVRTDTLERMQEEGKISLDDFTVLRYEPHKGVSDEHFVHSTLLYPEWPMAKLKHTSRDLADELAQLLFIMPANSEAAKEANCAGWTVPLNYQTVHDCLKFLSISPYENYGKVTLVDIVRNYGWWLFTIAVLVVIGTTVFIYLNSRANVEKKYSVFLWQFSPSALFSVDMNKKIIRWNHRAEELTGYKKEEVIGKDSCLVDDSLSEDLDLTGQAPIRGKEDTIKTKDGRRLQILKNVESIKNVKGETVGGIESFEDVTELRRAEKKIYQFRTALDNSADQFFIIDRNTMRFIDVNETACHDLQYSEDELLNLGPQDINPYHTRETLTVEFDKIIKEQTKTGKMETVHKRKNGDEIPVEVFLRFLEIEGRGVVIATARDITERKKSEIALKEEYAFSKSLIDTAQVVILVVDTESRIVRINPYMEKISGFSMAEVLGKDWFDTFLPPQDHSKTRALFKKSIEDIKTVANVNPILTKNGVLVQIEWFDKTLKDNDGNTIGVLAVGQDITSRKKDEENLKKTNRVMTGRELRIIEVKKEVNDLLEELGRPKKYCA